MADINVERKGPSIWPWVIGLLVLALLIWAIAEMVDTDEEVTEVAEVEEVEEPPAAVPEPEPAVPDVEVMEIETLLPLGPEDAGIRAEVEGTVVGEPIDEGFWVRTEDNTVIFVMSDRPVEMGEDVDAVFGTITTAPEQRTTDWADQANLRVMEGFDDWDVQGEYYLDGTAEAEMAPDAQQPAPGEQQPTADDTVRGRY